MFQLSISFLFLFHFNLIMCQRRVVDGHLAENARYMAYLLKSSISPKAYTAWLCGGCIVHPRFILTSTTCIMDVLNVYAIVGYKKYVKAELIDEDECTKRIKKKVISYCYDRGFGLHMHEDNWWNWRDIALAKVETPYDFQDDIYSKFCSYQPTLIDVSYNKEFTLPGRDVIILGWGSSQFYRPEGSVVDLNEDYLLYGSSVILTKDECRPSYLPSGGRFNRHISEHWICVRKLVGRLDLEGNIVRTFSEPKSGCGNQNKRAGKDPEKCVEPHGFRRFENSNATDTNETMYIVPTRRTGICQNDHGGPLVTWAGGRPYVIGIATAFLVDQHMRCRGPYAFTSIHCNSKLVYCTLHAQRSWWWSGRRSSYCSRENDEFVEKNLNWKN